MKNNISKPIKDIQAFARQTHRRRLYQWIINKALVTFSLLLIIYLFWIIYNQIFYMAQLEWKIFPLTLFFSLSPFLFGKPSPPETIEFLENQIKELKGRLYLVMEPYPSVLDSKAYEIRAIKECASILKKENVKNLIVIKFNPGYLLSLSVIALTLIIFFFSRGEIKIKRISEKPIITYAEEKIKENEAALVLARSTYLKKMYLFSDEGTQKMIDFGGNKFGTMAKIKKTSNIRAGYRVWKSDSVKLKVMPSLFINKLTLKYEFPYYLEEKSFSDTLYDPEDEILIQALTGTEIHFSGISNLNLGEIKSKIKNKSIKDRNFSGSFTIKEKGKIEVSLIDTSLLSSSTINFFIDPIKDDPPSIEFLYPHEKYKLDKSMEVPIIIQAEDDYALHSTSLLYGKEKIELDLPAHSKFFEDSLILKIRNLLTGETLKMRGKATDLAGNKTLSSPLIIYMPTLEEIFGEYHALRDTLETHTQHIEEKEKEIINKIESFLNKGNLGYEIRHEISKTLKDQKDLIEGMRKLSELSNEIRNPEVSREIDRIKELIDNKQLKDFMSDLNKIMGTADIDPEILNKLNSDQKDLLKTLELFKKSLQYLKKLLELNEFSLRAEEIYKKQQEITYSEPNYYQSETERNLAKELERLIQDMEKSSEERIKNIASEFKNTNTIEDMNDLANVMKQGKTNETNVKKIEQNLRNLNISLKDVRKQRAGKELVETIKKKGWELGFILRTHNNLIDMNPSVEKALIEEGLREALGRIERELQDLFIRTLAFSPEVFTDIKRAKEKLKSLSLELTKRQVPRSTMERVNDLLIQAILKLFSAPPPSSESLASALRQIIEQQNSIMNGLERAMPIPIPDLQNKGTFKKLSEKQRQLAENLRKMGKAFEPLSSEMEEMANNLERGMLDRKLIERQKKVLDRLLEAENAIREGEASRKRHSEPGIFVSPEKVYLPKNLGEEKKSLRELLEKRINEPYPEEYKKEIEKYFRELIE